jgi:hypothetical protein
MAYRIGSFNMFKFSFRSDNEIRKNIKQIARIIYEQQFEIIALQEVFSKNAMDLLLKELGEHRWQGVWEAPNALSTLAAEGYAYIWDKTRFRLSTTVLPDGSTRIFKPHIYNQYKVNRSLGQRQLIRNPYYARFEPINGAFCEFRLINVHIMFSRNSTHNNILDAGAILLRKREFDILTKSLYLSIADKVYGNNRPSYTIILGDYNLNLPFSGAKYAFLNEVVEIENGGTIRKLITVQKELTTLKSSPTEEQLKKKKDIIASYWANNFDHFTYDYDRFQGIGMHAGRINTIQQYCNNDYQLHRKEISDHVPITLDINLIK